MGDEDFVPPWQESGGHDIVEHSDTVVKCQNCEKMATDPNKLEQTPCLPDRDPGGWE